MSKSFSVYKADSLPKLLDSSLALDLCDVVIKERFGLVERDPVVGVPALVVRPCSIWEERCQRRKLRC